MPLSEIVNVTIDRQTSAVSTAGFGTLLIFGYLFWISATTPPPAEAQID